VIVFHIREADCLWVRVLVGVVGRETNSSPARGRKRQRRVAALESLEKPNGFMFEARNLFVNILCLMIIRTTKGHYIFYE